MKRTPKNSLALRGAKLTYEPSSGRLAIGLPGPWGLVELSVERGNPSYYELLELLASKNALELGFSSLPLRLPLERVEQLLVNGLDPERYLSVGACAGGGAVALDLSDHLLVAGGAGTGKTELLKTIALHGATQKTVEVHLFSPWAKSWADNSWKKVLEVPETSGLRFLGSDELDAFYGIRSLARSLESRREALAAKGAGAIGGAEFPTVYLLLDETMGIFEPRDPGKSYLVEAVVKDLRLLLESGGALGVYVALSSQRPELIPSELRELFSARVLMGDPQRMGSSELVFGTQSVHGGGRFDGAWGRGTVLADGEQRLFQGYLVEDLG